MRIALTDSSSLDLETLSPETMQIVDSVCDDFERAWRQGESPNLELFLERAPVELRKLLLHELIAIDLPYRRELGQTTSSEHYSLRFSQLDIQQFRRIREQSLAIHFDLTLPSQYFAMDDPRSDHAVIGDFCLIREVGRGGMGIVFAAEQMSLRRQVALKILPASQLIGTRNLQRFQNEARAAASLHHPNIVPVYAVGSENGVHFYAMQLIHGRTLDQFDNKHFLNTSGSPVQSASSDRESTTQVDEAPDRARRIAKLGIQAAEALEHAHSMGIVHRDIKPSNLLLDETQKLWVTDFGLARFTADDSLTASGDLLGTLRFMSPEQALAKHGLVDHRTDIYSLGATLYEVIAGKPAFSGKDRGEILHKIAFDEPMTLRKIRADVPRDLETIVVKAMAKEPQGRYQSAEDMAADLRRFVEDRPVLAKRRTPWDELIRWTRRNRGLTAALVTTLVVVLSANVAVAWLWRLERQALQAMKIAQEETLRQSHELERSVYLQRIAMAEQELAYSSIGRAQQTLDRCRPELRHWEWGYLKRACNIFTREFRHFNAEAHCIRFAPKGDRIAVGYSDGTVRLWDIATGKHTSLQGHSAPVIACAFSPDGRLLATSSGDYVSKRHGEVMLWTLDADTPAITFSADNSFASSIGFSSDNKTLAVALWNKSLRLIDTLTKASQYRVTEHQSALKAVCFSPDGKTIATGDWNGTVLLTDAQSGRTIHRLEGHSGDVVQFAFDSIGEKMVSSSWDGSAILWNSKSGARLHTFHNAEILQRFGGKNNTVWAASLSANGAWAATGSEDGAVRNWDTNSGLPQAMPRGHQGAVKGIDYSPDGKQIASVGLDGALRLWDASQTDIGIELPVQVGRYKKIEFSPNGRWLAAASGPVPVRNLPGRLVVLDLAGIRSPFLIAERPEGFRSPVFDESSRHVIADAGRDVEVWDAKTGEHLQSLLGDSGMITSVAILQQETLIAGDDQGVIQVWDRRSGQRTSVIHTPLQDIGNLVTDRNAYEWVAVASNGQVLIGRMPSQKGWSTFQLPREPIDGTSGNPVAPRLAYSSSTKRLAIGLDSGTVELWNTATMQLTHTLPGHPGSAMALSFSSDGDRLVSGGKDGTIVLWDSASGQEAMVLRKQLRSVASISFSPDDSTLAAVEDLAEKITLWSVGDRR
jgi:eukaryotic-like serine/threonine-protein kinase